MRGVWKERRAAPIGIQLANDLPDFTVRQHIIGIRNTLVLFSGLVGDCPRDRAELPQERAKCVLVLSSHDLAGVSTCTAVSTRSPACALRDCRQATRSSVHRSPPQSGETGHLPGGSRLPSRKKKHHPDVLLVK
jgi:hypothetical protein